MQSDLEPALCPLLFSGEHLEEVQGEIESAAPFLPQKTGDVAAQLLNFLPTHKEHFAIEVQSHKLRVTQVSLHAAVLYIQ